jgi:hypothetical protein
MPMITPATTAGAIQHNLQQVGINPEYENVLI